MPQETFDDMSTLVQAMAWCHQPMHQAITWANIDPDLHYHMVSLLLILHNMICQTPKHLLGDVTNLSTLIIQDSFRYKYQYN